MTAKADDILGMIGRQLKDQGIDLDSLCEKGIGAALKVVCVSPNLEESMRELGEATRDQVVMVRIDDKTSKTLDDWVEAGAVRSRSEGAALFIREGLKVRAEELGQLRDALADVESARRRLREKAKAILDADIEQEGDNDK